MCLFRQKYLMFINHSFNNTFDANLWGVSPQFIRNSLSLNTVLTGLSLFCLFIPNCKYTVRQEHALFLLSYCPVVTPSCNRVNKILQLSMNVFILFSLWRSERANKETIKNYLHSKQQRSILTCTGMFSNDATLQTKVMLVKYSDKICSCNQIVLRKLEVSTVRKVNTLMGNSLRTFRLSELSK